MGFLTLAILGAVAFGAMALFGLKRPLWSIAGAALMLGATGYALQGSPFLPGQPARPLANVAAMDPGLIDLRGPDARAPAVQRRRRLSGRGRCDAARGRGPAGGAGNPGRYPGAFPTA